MSINEHGRSVQVRQYSERSVRFAFPRIPIEQARIRESPSSLSGKGLGSVSVKLAGLGDVLVRLRRHFWPFQEQLYSEFTSRRIRREWRSHGAAAIQLNPNRRINHVFTKCVKMT